MDLLPVSRVVECKACGFWKAYAVEGCTSQRAGTYLASGNAMNDRPRGFKSNV